MVLSRLIRFLKIAVRRLYVLLNNLDHKFEKGLDKRAHDYLVRRVAGAYDMVKEVDEGYYANQYSRFIFRELQQRKLEQGGVLLDLACGQGRIIDKLQSNPGLEFEKIIGVDFSAEVLVQAQKYLNVNNKTTPVVELIESDIIEFLENCPDNSANVVLLLEVLYMLPNFESVLKHMRRVLRPGGVVFISLRSEYYYGLSILRQGLFASIPLILEQDRGVLFGNGVEMNWTNKFIISSRFLEKYSLEVGNMVGLGTCSGIANDPHDFICRPSDLSSHELQQLQQIEDHFGKRYPEAGRYMLFVATST
jgi:ubiquinone/menaquinone biosynthesis C-methylase UbiE